MALDDERGFFAGRPGMIRIVRGKEQPERGVAARRWEFHGPRRREIVGETQVRLFEHIGGLLDDAMRP